MSRRVYHKRNMRVISYDTYAKYAKKYGIALKSGARKKTMPMLAKQIYAHEKARPKLKGLYFY